MSEIWKGFWCDDLKLKIYQLRFFTYLLQLENHENHQTQNYFSCVCFVGQLKIISTRSTMSKNNKQQSNFHTAIKEITTKVTFPNGTHFLLQS